MDKLGVFWFLSFLLLSCLFTCFRASRICIFYFIEEFLQTSLSFKVFLQQNTGFSCKNSKDTVTYQTHLTMGQKRAPCWLKVFLTHSPFLDLLKKPKEGLFVSLLFVSLVPQFPYQKKAFTFLGSSSFSVGKPNQKQLRSVNH